MKKYIPVVILTAFLFILYLIPALIAPFDEIWYDSLIKPVFTPPKCVFPIVWPILFLLISISAILTLRTKACEKRFYMTLLILNYFFIQIYPYIQFQLKDILLAFVDILLVLITSFMLYLTGSKINLKASYLIIPLIVWVIFASFLQVGILKYN